MSGAADVKSLPSPRLKRRGGFGDKLDVAIVILCALALWQFGALTIGSDVLSSPALALKKLYTVVTDPDFAGHLWETGRAFGTALVLALFGGLILGILLGIHRFSGEVAEPILSALYAIPKVTLYPVILLLFGLGISAKIAFGVIHGIIPVTLFTMNAVRNIRSVYFRTARSLRLTFPQLVWTIVLPATLPEIVSGFRLGFALTLLGTLIGEMFASQRGIGYMLIKAMETNDVDMLMALSVLLTVFATVASAGLLYLDRRLHAPS